MGKRLNYPLCVERLSCFSLRQAGVVSDLDRILKEGKWAFIRSIESGAALGGKLENVDHFAKLNFKMMTLTWNGINELGSGSRSEMGLTDFGKAAVRRMEEVGMIVDCYQRFHCVFLMLQWYRSVNQKSSFYPPQIAPGELLFIVYTAPLKIKTPVFLHRTHQSSHTAFLMLP